MEIKKTEKITQLNARVPISVRDAFDETVPKGTNKQHVMTAMARLWISLPGEIRKQLIDAEAEDRPIEKALGLRAAENKRGDLKQ